MRYCLLKSQSWVITARLSTRDMKSNPNYEIAVAKNGSPRFCSKVLCLSRETAA